jgi:hypothetical protein
VLQNRTFVNINLYQKKIDPTLLCDLATAVPDLQNELTWPGQIAKRLNQIEPLKGKIKISELDKGKPTTIASVARYALLESLLGHNRKSQSWDGPLCAYAPFNAKATLDNATNKTALSRQVNLVQRFLAAVRENTKHASAKKDPWANVKEYSLLKPTGINALFLLLSRILEKYPRVEKDIGKDLQAYLKPLKGMRFTSKFVAEQGGGWKGFRSLANIMIRKINAANHDSLRLFGEKEKE